MFSTVENVLNVSYEITAYLKNADNWSLWTSRIAWRALSLILPFMWASSTTKDVESKKYLVYAENGKIEKEHHSIGLKFNRLDI